MEGGGPMKGILNGVFNYAHSNFGLCRRNYKFYQKEVNFFIKNLVLYIHKIKEMIFPLSTYPISTVERTWRYGRQAGGSIPSSGVRRI